MLRRRTFNAGLLASAALPMPAIAQGLQGKRGGDVIIAQQAQPPTLDAQTTTAQASRNITLHVYETLFTRDEASNPKPDLAEGVDIAADGLTYRFTLRTGVKFHNGKTMTSADVKASMERYGRIGGSAYAMKPVAAIETPDAKTVVMKLSSVSPGFIEAISSPRAPFAIMPEEECAKPLGQPAMIGTGPFRFVEFRPDSHAKLARFDDYVPNTNYQKRDGFAGRKTAFFDTVTFRFMPEGGARTAGLQTGELQVLEALDVAAAKRLKDDKNVRTYEMMPWAFQTLMMNTNWGPTANVDIRRAIQAALDLEEIMAICSDGLYRMDPAWQYPGTNYFPGIDGLDAYIKQDQAKARALLQKAGYKGEELEVVTDNAFRNHLDTGTVAAQQLRAVGMNVKLSVMDWPTVLNRRTRPDGWNLWPLGMGIEPYEGPYNVVGFFSGAQPVQIKADPVIEEAQKRLTTDLSLQGRIDAVKQFQARVYDQAISVKVGDIGIVQATRANVVNYAPYRIPRMWDCWFA
ncbi:ABC transporter substrate-binding protein [Rhodovastum sp. RN2-1]|uniref:ABC transporter substrate-binding protein n=2 Tax=Limobrevibacterium gyesilva TaxID=2991712 RepID=A0AA41YNP3_9PROT|nr:ABC transporter substrate-binding protein [Limobrevibacterium gyesilva]